MPRPKTGSPAKAAKALDKLSLAAKPSASGFSLMKGDPASSPELLDHAWQVEARAALRIADTNFAFLPDADGKLVRHEFPSDFVDPAAHSLRLTFKKFKLDPDDPWSWHMLARYLSMIFFSKPPAKKGRPIKWTSKLLMELEREASAMSASKAAHRLANDKKSAFHVRARNSAGVVTNTRADNNSGAEGLRKAIGKARRKSPGKVETK
jgi:hypothetical protein